VPDPDPCRAVLCPPRSAESHEPSLLVAHPAAQLLDEQAKRSAGTEERQMRREEYRRARDLAGECLRSALFRERQARRRASKSPVPASRGGGGSGGGEGIVGVATTLSTTTGRSATSPPCMSPASALAPVAWLQPLPSPAQPTATLSSAAFLPSYEPTATMLPACEGGSLLLEQRPRDEIERGSERSDSRATSSDVSSAEIALSCGNLERLTGATGTGGACDSLTPARNVRRASQGTDDNTPTRRSTRIAKQHRNAASGS
tara:strand:+ start:169 stop:948 length:780 start_codon:yes stop_codon:yes gene_type:complete